jgi:hypothetical protein
LLGFFPSFLFLLLLLVFFHFSLCCNLLFPR